MTLFQTMRRGLLPAGLTVDELYELTEAGVLREGERVELIDGKVMPMAAAKANWHSIMAGKLNWALHRLLPDTMRIHPAPSLTLTPKTLLEPDLAILPRGSMIRETKGPDIFLLIEVADSSLSYDLKVKAPLYAAFGVREYWVVDAIRRTIRVHRQPTTDDYADVEEYEAHDAVEALIPGVSIRLDQLD